MAHLLGGEGLHLDFGTGTVLDSVTIGLDDGDRIGMVGTNGAGKSSLMKLLAGILEPHEGRVTVKRGVRIGVLDQSDFVAPDLTVIEAIMGEADTHEWASDPRVRDIMAGLVSDVDADSVVRSLSGGQQRRVALARVLVGEHDVIFLDEPTNHLDVEGVTWLADHLKRRWSATSGALVVVTHDRWFLDEISNDTWEVHDGLVEQFEGGYAAYVLQRVERDRILNATESKRQNLMRKELAWLRRGAPARTSKPKFRIDAANELIADVPPIRDSISLERMAMSRLGKEVVNLLNVGVTYGEGDTANEVLAGIEWRIGPGERTGILGENGAGKSTLLKLITGELDPSVGHVKRGKTVKVATLSQQLLELDEHGEERVRTLVKSRSTTTLADGSELSPKQLLERMGFTNAQLSTQVKKLSGGQRRRLQLLLILLDEPNVLVLDEPSNDLDTDMLAALEDLLDSWPGALIVVSHDRYLMERITDQQYAVIDKGLRHLPGGIDEYVRLSRARRSTSGGVGNFGGKPVHTATVGLDSMPVDDEGSGRERKRTKSMGANASASSAPAAPAADELSGADRRLMEKELAALERKMFKLTQQVKKLNAQMLEHDHADHSGLGELASKTASVSTEIESLELQWLELSDALGQ